MNDLAGRLAQVRERMAAAEARSGRAAGSGTLVAVGKTHPPAILREAVGAGATVLGENTVQEALAKAPEVPGASWHLVGHLQRNKARRAVELFALIHTLDSVRLADRLDGLGRERGAPVPVLVEVNLSREAGKAGVLAEDLPALLDACSTRGGIAVLGLMTVPVPPERPDDSRPAFALLRRLAEVEVARGRPGVALRELSMGMTDDFEVAIEEGATLVRVGRAIFGPRGV